MTLAQEYQAQIEVVGERIPGMAWRAATMDDMPAVTELVNARSYALRGKKEITLRSMTHDVQTPGFSLETDTRMLIHPQDGPLAYIEAWDVNKPPVKVYLWPIVHPEYDGTGLGDVLMLWGIERAREAIGRAPKDARVIAITDVSKDDSALGKLMQRHGLSCIRQAWEMEISLAAPPPEPVWPPGIVVKTYDLVDDAEAMYRSQEEAFRDHWGFVEEDFDTGFKRWTYHIFAQGKFDPALTFLAMDGDEVAGGAISKPRSDTDPDQGFVRELWVRRPWRRQGLGLALLLHSFAVLREMGKSSAGLGVDSQNMTGATRLYEKAGMTVDRAWDQYELELRAGEDLVIRTLDS